MASKTCQQLWEEIPSDQEEQHDQAPLDDDSEFDKLIEDPFDPFDYSESTEVYEPRTFPESPYEPEDPYDPEDFQSSTEDGVFEDHVHVIPEATAKRIISIIRACLTFDMPYAINNTLEDDEDTYEPMEFDRSKVKFANFVTMVVLPKDTPREPCFLKPPLKPLKSCMKVTSSINYVSERKAALKQSRISTRDFIDRLDRLASDTHESKRTNVTRQRKIEQIQASNDHSLSQLIQTQESVSLRSSRV